MVEPKQACLGQGNGSGVPRTVRRMARPIHFGDVRLPVGYRAGEKPTFRMALTVAGR
ncbi:MAG: hypothetical protein WAO35_07675 [Terriglobia bacterium]